MKKLVRMGKYDPALLADYTREEWDEMDGFIDHWRDMTFSYAAVKQLEGKYLVQNRVTGEIYESAQFLYLLVARAYSQNIHKKPVWITFVVSTMQPQPLRFLYQRLLWQGFVRLLVNSALAY